MGMITLPLPLRRPRTRAQLQLRDWMLDADLYKIDVAQVAVVAGCTSDGRVLAWWGCVCCLCMRGCWVWCAWEQEEGEYHERRQA